MQTLKTFNKQRAEIYWWFSSLFAKELTEQDLVKYHDIEIRSFLTTLGENEALKPTISKLIKTLNRLQDREDAQLELAADFCELFLKTDKHGALPYASLYIGKSGLLNDTPAQEMEELLTAFGVEVDKELNEPADHLAIELDYLGNLIVQSNQNEQQAEMEQAFTEISVYAKTSIQLATAI